MANVGRYRCRLCLNDFIGDNEELIITAMKLAVEKTNGMVCFTLWHTPDIVSDATIQKFCSTYEKELQFIGTRILNEKNDRTRIDKVWFDVISIDDVEVGDKHRFRYIYTDRKISEIVYGIYEFRKAVDFFENKPEKKPKYIKRINR